MRGQNGISRSVRDRMTRAPKPATRCSTTQASGLQENLQQDSEKYPKLTAFSNQVFDKLLEETHGPGYTTAALVATTADAACVRRMWR